jgi:4-hydroxy-3-methylbut-2-en-1-yl diphosphate reductase
LQIYLARHFGFCYGVENAIEIAFRTIDENPGKRIFLLSEMIHNPKVNADLLERGVQFLQDTSGNMLIPFEDLTTEDIIIIPAFGTTLAMEERINALGISTKKYNTTCPFVEKVWNRGEQIAKKNYSVIVHGKPTHEETRATFSHRYSAGFDIEKDLTRVGVINQTTMLASDTQGIADFIKSIMMQKYALNETNIAEHFADTRDTLCYATNDNQSAVYGLLQQEADMAIVVGGYNSSNTSHLVELCEEKLQTYFINGADKITAENNIFHYDLHKHTEKETLAFLPNKTPLKILITSGASCPDAIVEDIIKKICSLRGCTNNLEELMKEFSN